MSRVILSRATGGGGPRKGRRKAYFWVARKATMSARCASLRTL